MSKKILKYNRIGLLLASLSLLTVFFFPLWEIELSAPQYPEGLEMHIWINKLSGDVEIISGLNHYIGMRELHEEDFPEFIYLPYIIGAFIFMGLLSAVLNRRWMLIGWSISYILFGIIAMADFYRWEYDYGHDLNPNAPIQIPGMSYQPPLIGYKQLLNFGAYSIPDVAGWVFIGCGLLASVFLYAEWKSSKKLKVVSMPVAVMLCSVIFLSACTVEPQPIRYGKDNCDFCKMTIVDQKYGAEILTKKGKAYKFDDTNCIVKYMASGEISNDNIQGTYFIDINKAGNLLLAETAVFLRSEKLHSPMAGNVATFENLLQAEAKQKELEGTILKWAELKELFK